ncbi:MAG: hypothetical protein M1824_006553 [Vezdaea acicularis]|nr:MAG: hypothetical protein M1824_006553 [Vezdaea acicularis]
MEVPIVLHVPQESSELAKPLGMRETRPQSYPLQRSITDHLPTASTFYNAFPNLSTSHLPYHPPEYDLTEHTFKLPPSRFSVVPREEEGRELLPGYSCSLKHEAIFQRKVEQTSPFELAGDRSWKKVFVVLQGTMLNIHKIKTPFFGTASTDISHPDRPTGTSAGALIKSYTLQHADVGVAADYRKLNHVPFQKLFSVLKLHGVANAKFRSRQLVIRVRAETEQFLLCCTKIDTLLTWLEALSAAIDLSPPLEERTLPKYQTLPRRRRRRARDVMREQERIIREQFPNLLEEESENSRAATRRSRSQARAQQSSDERRRNQSLPPLPTDEQSQTHTIHLVETNRTSVSSGGEGEPSSPPPRRRGGPSLTLRPPEPSADDASEVDVDISEMREDLGEAEPGVEDVPALHSPTGSPSSSSSSSVHSVQVKWCPEHHRDRAAELRRARRCSRILVASEPRLGGVIVKDGKKWRIDFEQERLVECLDDLPCYKSPDDEAAEQSYRRRRGLIEQGM